MTYTFIFELNNNFKKLNQLSYLYIFFIFSIAIASILLPASIFQQAWQPWLWVVMLFTILASTHMWWEEDEEAGLIEQWRLSSIAVEKVVLAKLLVQELTVIIPLSLISAGWIRILGVDGVDTTILALSLMAGGVQIVAISMLSAAIGRAQRWLGGVLAIIVMPLVLPTILFGKEAVTGSQGQALLLLLGYVCFTVPLTVLGIGASLRSSQ